MYPHCNERPAQITNLGLGLDDNARKARVHSLTEANPVFETIQLWMKGEGFPQKDRFAVNLALQEAFSNAVRHGNGGNPNKSVQIAYVVRKDEVVVEIEDQGAGFDPNAVPNPLHAEHIDRCRCWGLFMMRAYTTWMSFNFRGNRVMFGRQRSKD